MSRSNILSVIAAVIVLSMCAAFVIFGMVKLSGVDMTMHGWIALGLGSTVSLALGGVLSAVLIISRRRGFDEAAWDASRHSEPDL